MMDEADHDEIGEAQKCFEEAYEKQSKGQLAEAIALYQKSIELHPTAEAYTFLGWGYSQQGRFKDAIEEFVPSLTEEAATHGSIAVTTQLPK